MNRKIFTLLACALMLFSTVFTINAKVVGGNLAVGDIVRTLPTEGEGMYHLRIDSIYAETALNSGVYEWQSVHGAVGTNYVFPDYDAVKNDMRDGDTVIVAVTESGRVIPVSASDLRLRAYEDISYTDLQATMWCTQVQDYQANGQMPTFRFRNNVFGMDLDFKENTTYVSGENKGWMFSRSYVSEVDSSVPLRRFADELGYYNVLSYDFDNGYIYSQKVTNEAFINSKVPGMLKFSLVEVAPVVLDAAAFNSKLGTTTDGSLTQLSFYPEPNSTEYPNYFGFPLKAEDDAEYGDYGYLNLYVEGGSDVIYNVGYNPNATKLPNGTYTPEDDDRYTNDLGVTHLRILADGKYDPDWDNNKYRFVYFPSQDSVVINAFKAGHYEHNSLADGLYIDSVAAELIPAVEYTVDTTAIPVYYGLYTKTIQDRLIVRIQDLYGAKGSSLMTIGELPTNTRISFETGCEVALDAWTPADGVYTIWDHRGRMLGVRPYNGALTAQWIELHEGECPDRIPSYQWVVERVDGENSSSPRVNITNREFGNLISNSGDFLRMTNVLIKNGSSPIFQNQGQFYYYPYKEKVEGFETINYGYVTGAYLEVADQASCVIEENSGFRPVNKEYVNDQYLGYKHFNVDTDPNSVSFGKSDDVVGIGDMTEKGMDYNAFAFNYLHEYSEKGYIDLMNNKGDSILHVSTTGKEGFQFRLGTKLRKAGLNFQTEKYGYPDTGYPTDGTIDYNANGEIQNVPRLERYYYELKVADFYNYRDGLAEQFVVLKGATDDGSDIANKFNYGVADVWADTDPFKFANVYLRETYFLEREKTLNEERKSQDPSRRTFYALIDRIEEEQFDRLSDMGYEILDTIRASDASSLYGILMLNVDDHTGIIRGVTTTVASATMSTFALENMNYPLYRRLASKEDDGAVNNGDGAVCPFDAPKTLRIYSQKNQRLFLYEDATSAVSDNLGINFLGQANIDQYPEDVARPDGSYYNYNLFVDTAYINRGTGWIKPQYLIAVGAQIVDEPVEITYMDACNEEQTKVLKPYIRARYLINATDSARQIGSNGSNLYPVRDNRYIIYSSWDRLAFVDAIHVDDRLYIVSELQKAGIPESSYLAQAKDGQWYVSADSLADMATDGRIQAREPLGSSEYGAYYDFDDWQNYHNDVSFSLRFVNNYAQNPDPATGEGGTDNDSKAFLIESETTNRQPYGNAKIAPVQGGWIKMQNDVPVMTRGSYEDAIGQAEIFNVEIGTGEATANDPVAAETSVKVISGTDEISVLNANGKQVTVTNLLGQTIANMVSNGDNVTVKAPKGIVIVTVEGEKAVKSIVK